MIGRTLNLMREKKGYSLREASDNILSPSQLRRVESDEQIPSADKFIHLLYRMNMTFDEFCDLSDNEYVKIRTILPNKIGDVVRTRKRANIERLLEQVNVYAKKYPDNYFNHMQCVLKAHLCLIINSDYTQARIELTEVKEYLASIEYWCYYELTLFNNTLFIYELDTAVSLGDKALNNIQKRYSYFKAEEITRRLLNNLAIYTLDDKLYHMKSFQYSSMSIGLPNSTKHIYSVLLAKIINQVASYKLDNNQYNAMHLKNLLNFFLEMNMEEIYSELSSFLKKHDISLDL